VLVLPNLAAMSQSQVAALELYVANGGSVIATSESSLFDGHGDPQADFQLGALFGVHRKSGTHGGIGAPDPNIETHARHSYLRLSPEIRAGVYGPHDANAPLAKGERHPILAGLESTDTIPFGGYLPVVEVDDDVQVLASFVPDFPIYPPETSWMRTPSTDLSAITVRQAPSGGKLIWFVADLDRCFAREEQFEHALLFANAARWALGERSLLNLTGGHGVVTASLFAQGLRRIVHLNNHVLLSRVPGRQYDLLPVGPIEVRLQGLAAPVGDVELRVRGKRIPTSWNRGELAFVVDQVVDHEVVVIG
jgi:hypothetical protein